MGVSDEKPSARIHTLETITSFTISRPMFFIVTGTSSWLYRAEDEPNQYWCLSPSRVNVTGRFLGAIHIVDPEMVRRVQHKSLSLAVADDFKYSECLAGMAFEACHG
jgi:hypothetical protein